MATPNPLAGGYPYNDWPRDVDGKPIQPTHEGNPILYGRGPTGELYSIHDTYASPLERGVPFIHIPTLEQ